MRYKTKHPLYNTYRNMKARCYNKKAPNYRWYGGKGVKVCEAWLKSFDRFVADMGPKPEPSHVLVRTDSTKNYEPTNCQWGPKGSEDRRPPEVWEYALRLGEKISKSLETLESAKEHRDVLEAKAAEKGAPVALEIVRRTPGGEWHPILTKQIDAAGPIEIVPPPKPENPPTSI